MKNYPVCKESIGNCLDFVSPLLCLWWYSWNNFSKKNVENYLGGKEFSPGSVYQENNFLISILNICCGYSKEPSQWDGSFEHPKQMLKLMSKKIFTILCSNLVVILTHGIVLILNLSHPFYQSGWCKAWSVRGSWTRFGAYQFYWIRNVLFIIMAQIFVRWKIDR